MLQHMHGLSDEQGLALSSQALATNSFDGHTLHSALQKAESLAKTIITRSFVDRGYKGHGVEDKTVIIAGQKRGMTKALKQQLKRRSAIEPHIGHMKATGKLRRNYLKGTVGDAMNAILCAIGHNLRMIWRRIRDLLTLIWGYLMRHFQIKNQPFNPLI